jgi:hypothetical protein
LPDGCLVIVRRQLGRHFRGACNDSRGLGRLDQGANVTDDGQAPGLEQAFHIRQRRMHGERQAINAGEVPARLHLQGAARQAIGIEHFEAQVGARSAKARQPAVGSEHGVVGIVAASQKHADKRLVVPCDGGIGLRWRGKVHHQRHAQAGRSPHGAALLEELTA